MASNEAMWGLTSSGGPAAAGPCALPTVPRLLRSHACDWIALLLLVAADAVLNLVEPFHRFVGAGMMADLRYPMKANTIPVWAVPVIAVIGPVVIFLIVYIRRRNVYDLHHAILGILFAVVITGVLTDAIKDAVGRPRPNYFWRCFPDGKAVYDNITTGVICHGDPSVIKEGHKSFPSGHTSSMPGIDIDLNQTPPESALDDHIDWDEIEEWDGPANELDYDMIWHDVDQGDQDGDGTTEGVQVPAADQDGDGQGAAADQDGDGQGSAADQDGDGQGAVADGQGAAADQDDAAVHAVQAEGVPAADGQRGSNNNKRRYYGDELKIAIYLELLAKTDPPILRRGVTKGVARKFGVPQRVVQSIWKKGQEGGINGIVNKWSKNCGRKRIQVDMESIKGIPLRQRTTLRDLAHALGVKKSTLHNRLKEGYFRRHTNDLKFSLTDANKKARVKYCLSMLFDQSLCFNPMYNVIYIDEKWFYRTRRNQKFYLANDEERPQRAVKSKNFIEKVMFLAVVTRPRFDENGRCTFDGKLGIFPFTTVEPAKRWSPNRDAGTLVTKAMTSVTKDVSRDFLINKVLPAIKAKWPAEEKGMPIYIQQDNAKTHIAVNDPAFVKAAQADGWDIRLTCQPPNSPDLNVLDLGFFAAIQALFEKGTPNNIEEIVTKVGQAYQEYPVQRANRIFLTQQGCMMEIMKHNGGQHYNIPHMKKKTLEMQGCLPTSLSCTQQLYSQAIQFVA